MNDAKEYLSQYEKCERKVRNKLYELERMRSLATKVTSSLSGEAVSGTKNNDKMSDTVTRIIELQNEINECIDACIDKKKEIETVIDGVTNIKQHDILVKRYVLLMTWEQIACAMDYSYWGACKLHGRALQAVETLLKEERRDA